MPVLTAARTVFTTSEDVDRQVREKLASGEGLYTIDTPTLKALQPDIIITQSLCSVCSIDFDLIQHIVATEMASKPPKIIDLNPQSIQDVLQDILRVGECLGLLEAAKQAVEVLEGRISRILALPPMIPKSAAFIEWTDPIFIGGHWTPQLITLGGGMHPLNPPVSDIDGAGKSIVLTPQQLLDSLPKILIICPCGLNLATTKVEVKALTNKLWFNELCSRAEAVYLVDGNQMFNRPGPRLVEALEFLAGIFHDDPGLIPQGFPYERL